MFHEDVRIWSRYYALSPQGKIALIPTPGIKELDGWIDGWMGECDVMSSTFAAAAAAAAVSTGCFFFARGD